VLEWSNKEMIMYRKSEFLKLLRTTFNGRGGLLRARILINH
jgi:hypothetical protein